MIIRDVIIPALFITLCTVGCQKADLATDEDILEEHGKVLPEGTPTPPSIDTICVKTIPEPRTMWNNHLVYKTETDYDEDEIAMVYLLARDEYDNVSSAKNEDYPDEAEKLTELYAEEDVTGWEIPTTEEAKFLHEIYTAETQNFSIINELLNRYTPLSTTERYLCSNAEKTFSFTNTSAPSTAGVKKKYLLRPVKRIVMYTKNYKWDDDDEDIEPVDTTSYKPADNDSIDETRHRTIADGIPYEDNGHIVVFDSINADGSHTLVWLSRDEFSATKSDVKEKAKAYSEDGITGWEIPSEDLAKRLRDTYGIDAKASKDDLGDLTPLNQALYTYTTITPRKSSGYNRYICSNADYSFAFVKGNALTPITSGSTTYKVRLVKFIKK